MHTNLKNHDIVTDRESYFKSYFRKTKEKHPVKKRNNNLKSKN